MSEKKLWNRLRSGEHQALEEVYRNYFSVIYNYGKKFTQDIGTIEDCIQELFIDLWNNREGLSETDSIKPYLYVSLRRRLFKSLKTVRKSTDIEATERHFEAQLAVEDILINKEIKSEKEHALKNAFSSLSSRQKEILYLKFYADLGYDEISKIMDLNYQSARNLVSRALQKLSSQMLLFILAIFCWSKLSTILIKTAL